MAQSDPVFGPVWVTKYALTTGISRHDTARLCSGASTDMISVPMVGGVNGQALYHRPDWHDTEEAAVLRARQMRDAKIKSLEKQLAKLAAAIFEVKENHDA